MEIESTYKLLAKALEPLELAGTIRYLPNFSGLENIYSGDWGPAEGFVCISSEDVYLAGVTLSVSVGSFDDKSSDEEERRIGKLVADALLAGGFETYEKFDGPTGFDPNFKPQTFRMIPFPGATTELRIRGLFRGKPKPTKAVRERAAKLGLRVK